MNTSSVINPTTYSPFQQEEDDTCSLTMRALFNSNEAGIIIGKGGRTIARARAMNVKAGITKHIEGTEDRILTVSGQLHNVVNVIMFLVRQVIGNLQIPKFTLRLLVSHLVMGTVIGRQGARIQYIEKVSGVHLMCCKSVLPQSTERVVELSGSANNIEKALTEVGACLLQDKDRANGTIYYNPEKMIPSPPRFSFDDDNFIAKTRTDHVTISEDLIGRVIGKGGNRISEIRRTSQCSILIPKKQPHDMSGIRVITLQGTHQQTAKALSLLHSQIEREMHHLQQLHNDDNITHDLIDLSD